MEFVDACSVRVGDDVLTSAGKAKVLANSIVHAKGAYAPLTRAGTLYVEDVAVSCYAHATHSVAHIALLPLRLLGQFSDGQEEGMHWYVSALLRLRSLWNGLFP